MRALITGGAGFIGSHLTDHLLNEGWGVTVIDNFDPFYDISLKKGNIRNHLNNPDYRFVECDLVNAEDLKNATEYEDYDVIVHLAAKAGVRPSIANPASYMDVNVKGTQNMLDLAREKNIKQFVFASSSSVYGINPNVPWSEEDQGLMPISPYASTKVSGELMGHVYSHLFGIRFVGLRFFTVYGPRQRPDLAIHKFTRMILQGDEITMYGDGSTRRDYTFVGDIVKGIRAAMSYDQSQFEIINLGNHRTVRLSELIDLLSNVLEKEVRIRQMPEQPGDVPQTYADISKASRLLGYYPATSIENGLVKFRDWINSRMLYQA